jgi:hypothetical protein
MSGKEIVLDAFLEAAAQSFGMAQPEVGLPEGLQSAMLISSAELAVKAGLRFTGNKMIIEPVSAAAAAKGGVDSAALSTITIRYIAAQSDIPASEKPGRSTEDVVKEVAVRPDIVKLREILGELTMNAHYVRDVNLWTVKVTDDQERTVRVVTLADKK